VEVIRDGRIVDMLGPGQYFGEIALLKEVPRVATCRAATASELYALDRETFVCTVSGDARTSEEVEGVMRARLAGPGAPAHLGG
jgi:CRP-like cAMP-binding protein